MNIKIRPAILLGEIILGIGLCFAVYIKNIEAVLGIVGILGATMSKLVESEEKTDGNNLSN